MRVFFSRIHQLLFRSGTFKQSRYSGRNYQCCFLLFPKGSNRRGYSEFKGDRRPPNQRTYSGEDNQDYDQQWNDDYNNSHRENYSTRDSYGRRDNYGKRDNFGNSEHYGNRDETGYRNENRNFREKGERGGFRDRNKEGGRGGGRGREKGRERGGFRENRMGSREERESPSKQGGGRGKNSYDYERQHSGGGKENRDNRPSFDRQQSGGRDIEPQQRRQHEGRSDRDPGVHDVGGSKYKNESADRPVPRAYEKPSPKSYYTLSVTDDEKLMEEDYVQGVTTGIQDMNVTVTGDKRSFKERDRPRSSTTPRGQGSSQQGYEGTGPVSKHQPSLPPRLQQQQQQQERNKRQKQQQQQQPQNQADKQDAGQGRTNKRYSSQRQRTLPEGPGYTEPQVTQAPTSQQVVSSLQYQQST